jgi:uncharacterized protein (DUF1697 family)
LPWTLLASAGFTIGLSGDGGDLVVKSAALLRAVNVGGRKLAMTDLRRLVEQVGGRDVSTYLQSGNVVFSGPKRLGLELGNVLSAELGFDVPVLVRSGAQLAGIVASKPFDAEGAQVSVTLLGDAAASKAVAAIDPDGFGDDRFVVRGTEIYVYTPGGYGRSKLNNAFWERKLGVVATTRNWNTIVALAELTAAG